MYLRIKLNANKYTLIDKDNEIFNSIKWYYKNGYAIHTDETNGKRIALHRIIMKVKDSNILIDHINGNTLDNRKENLRIVNHTQNTINCKIRKNKTSKYLGVSFSDGKWRAQISINKKKIYIGLYDSEEKAKNAYDRYSKRYFKEYRRSTVTNLINFNDYPVLPRPKTQAFFHTYEVIVNNILTFKTITDAALYLNVKPNTITKACTSKKTIKKVKGQLVRYGKPVISVS